MPNINNRSQEYPQKLIINRNVEDDYWYQNEANLNNSKILD